MDPDKLRGMFGGKSSKSSAGPSGSMPNIGKPDGGMAPGMLGGMAGGPGVGMGMGDPGQQRNPDDMPSMNEMAAMMSTMKGPEADMVKNMMETMSKGDPQMMQQLQGYWKMLNGMAESTPDDYKQFIDKQMGEMGDHYAEERKKEEEKFTVNATPHFCFSIKAARVVSEQKRNQIQGQQSPSDIKLFDMTEQDSIKESFLSSKQTGEPLDSPKFYVNIVYADKVIPPLDKERNFADPKDDSKWLIIPIIFTEKKKRRNMNNVDCFHYDAHVNTCVIDKCKENQERLRAILSFIVQKFQHHIRMDYILHKRSLKLCKSKKYKHSLGNGSQKVAKFTLPKECHRISYLEQKAELDKKIKEQKEAAEKAKEVKLVDKDSDQASLSEIKLPGGGSTANLKHEEIKESQPAAKKVLIEEVKERPTITETTQTDDDGRKVVLEVYLTKESSAKDVDLDINQTEVKLESEYYKLHYKLDYYRVDPDSVVAKFSKSKKVLKLTLNEI